ncbi:MAG: ClpXP protease specificity-enhancing factor [Sulfuritalea sp.]|jgi:stringent starvation protein B|nr:ClpXP protease specificity-enhancing factor [Sulfuritalea sp.]
MKSTKPYLIRAIHEWCADQGFTPYIAVVVDATTRVPREFVKDGQIVLNVGLEATHQLRMGNEEITFQARFSGKTFPVVVPINRIAAIYASENGEGMAFDVTEVPVDEGAAGLSDTVPPEAESAAKAPAKPGRPVLTRVK